MFPTYESFKTRADTLRTRIAVACLSTGRDPATVELMAVTKTHPAAAVDYAARYGLRSVGENRVQEAVEKQPHCTAKIQWELVGHLQSNKAKRAAAHFDRVQSVESEKLLDQLDAAAAALGKILPVLLQINAGRDPAKFGAEIEASPRLLAAALVKTHLRIDGLMTIAPLSEDPAVAERTFATLRTLRDDLAFRFGVPLRELSMGMSADLELAIRAGSTQVRVGSALYGSR